MFHKINCSIRTIGVKLSFCVASFVTDESVEKRRMSFTGILYTCIVSLLLILSSVIPFLSHSIAKAWINVKLGKTTGDYGMKNFYFNQADLKSCVRCRARKAQQCPGSAFDLQNSSITHPI